MGLMGPSDSQSDTGARALRRWSGGQDAVHEARPDDAPGLDVRWIAVEGMQLSDPEGNV